jgi:hypothetical protein
MTPTTSPTRMNAWLELAWLTRYLDRQLASDEATWFEAYVLDKPELLAMIDADTRFRDALADDPTMRHRERSIVEESRQGRATAHGEAAADEHDGPRFSEQPTAIAQPTGTISIDSHPSSRTRRIAQPPRWFAIAATLLAGVGVGGIGVQSLSPRSSAPEIVANPTRIIYDTMRGEVTPPRVEYGDSRSPYVLVEVAVPPGAEHIVLNMDGLQEPVIVSSEGFVTFLAARKNLAAGTAASISYARRGSSDVTTLQLQPVDQ